MSSVRLASFVIVIASGVWHSVVSGPSELSNVTLTTSLPENVARPGQDFSVIGTATSSDSVTFSFYAATTSVKPLQAFYVETKTTCSDQCTSHVGLSAPRSKTVLYLWLDVTSGRECKQRSLTVLVISGASGERVSRDLVWLVENAQRRRRS